MLASFGARRLSDRRAPRWTVRLDGEDVSAFALYADDEEGWVEILLHDEETRAHHPKLIRRAVNHPEGWVLARGLRHGYVEIEEVP